MTFATIDVYSLSFGLCAVLYIYKHLPRIFATKIKQP
jgi:hypothetical protein